MQIICNCDPLTYVKRNYFENELLAAACGIFGIIPLWKTRVIP